jgi:hypothetical protein
MNRKLKTCLKKKLPLKHKVSRIHKILIFYIRLINASWCFGVLVANFDFYKNKLILGLKPVLFL